MENKSVGYILLGVSILIIIIVILFNNTMQGFVDATCSLEHGSSCPMYSSIKQQTYISFGIVGLLVVVSLILIFSKPDEKIIIKKVEKRVVKKKLDTSELNSDEKKVLSLVSESKAVFQAELIEKTEFGKAKMTRVIDRLEGKGFVERKRRGMTNVVVLKED